MAFYKQDIVDVNLETGVIHRSFLNHTIGHKDDDADRFGIRAFRNGEPVDLSGAQCQAIFMAPDGTNIALTSYGTVSGNEAYVTLPQACYNVEGQFCLAIKLVGGGVTATVRIIDGVVDRTGATGAVAPTGAVPTYQEILAVYAQMQEDVADYESVVATQDGKIDDLKSTLFISTGNKQIEMTTGGYYPLDGTSVTIGSPTPYSSQKYALIPCVEGDSFTVSLKSGPTAQPWGFVDSNGLILAKTNNTQTVTLTNVEIVAPADSAYLILNSTINDHRYSYYGRYIKNDVKYVKDAIAPYYDTSATYEQGEYVFYNGNLYRCQIPVTTAGEWNSNCWASVTVNTETKMLYDATADSAYIDENELTAIPYDWSQIGTSGTPLGWVRGYYNVTDGTESASASNFFIRTINSNVIRLDSVAFIVEPPDGYWIRVFRYANTDSAYKGFTTCIRRTVLLTNGDKLKFTVGRFNDGSASSHLTASFINQIKLTFLYKKEEQLIADNIIRMIVDIGTPTIYAEGIASSGGNYDTSNREKTQWISLAKDKTYRATIDSADYFIESCWISDTGDSSTATILRQVKPNNNTVVFTLNGDERYFRMSFGRTDSAVMTNDDKTAIQSALSVYTLTDTTSSIAGAIADAGELGKTIDLVKGGLIQVQYDWHKIGTSSNPLGWMRGYYDSASGQKQTSNYWIRTVYAFINLKEAVAFEVEPPEGYGIVVCEYTQNNQYIKQTSFTKKTLLMSNFNKYLFYVGRFDGGDSSNYLTQEFINQIKLTIYYLNVNNAKKLRTGAFEWFSVNVERPLAFGEQEIATTTQSIECVLRLPNSYSIAGEPTRLVLACHGASGYVDEANNVWYNSNWKTFMDQLLDAGYAVFDANVLPLSTGTNPNQAGYGVGSPLYINVLKKAYDYIVENYNVRKEIFVHGTSMGGVGATAFAYAYPQLVLAESSFAGRNTLGYMWVIYAGTPEERFAVSYGYNSLSDLASDHFSHIEGSVPELSLIKYVDGVAQIPPDRETQYEEWLAYYTVLGNLERADDPGIWMGQRKTPYKAWNSWADNEHYTKLITELVKIYNRGNSCPFYAVNYETGTHTQMSYGQINDMIPQLINWYKRWDSTSVVDDGGGD